MGRGKKQQSEQVAAAATTTTLRVDAEREQTATPDTTIVVPCYNEAGRLKSDEFLTFARDTPETLLLFVNDGSNDETLAILNRLQTCMPNQIEVYDLPRNVGKAEAVRAGMLRGCDRGSNFVGFWDADLATPLDHVGMFRRVFDDNPRIDMVFGARVGLLGRDIRRSMKRHYLGRVFATLASLSLGMGVYDTQCGSKLFRVDHQRGELRGVLGQPFDTRWVFDCEMIGRYAALRRGAAAAGHARPRVEESIFEFPLHKWEDVGGSKVKAGDIVKMAWGLWQVKRRYFWSQWPEGGGANGGGGQTTEKKKKQTQVNRIAKK